MFVLKCQPVMPGLWGPAPRESILHPTPAPLNRTASCSEATVLRKPSLHGQVLIVLMKTNFLAQIRLNCTLGSLTHSISPVQ